MPYDKVGAIIAFVRRAMVFAIANGAVLSAPLLMTPCGSRVPVGRRTVVIFDGTTSLNSIQLIRSISRVETTSDWAAIAPTDANSSVKQISGFISFILYQNYCLSGICGRGALRA